AAGCCGASYAGCFPGCQRPCEQRAAHLAGPTLGLAACHHYRPVDRVALAFGVFAAGPDGSAAAQAIFDADSCCPAAAVSERRCPGLFAVRHAVVAVEDGLWTGSVAEARL